MPSAQRAPAQPFNDVADYKHIALQPVKSSQISGIGHAGSTLAVQFKHGAQAIYHYPGVIPSVFAEFMAAESKGNFFKQHINGRAFEKYPASVLEGQPQDQGDTPATIAALLHGREWASRDAHITDDVVARALAAGCLIVCGASDDLVEFYGVWRDEAGTVDDDGAILIDATGVLPSWDQIQDDGDEEKAAEWHVRKRGARSIAALWSPSEPEGASWAYKTDIPHATFDIMEDGDIYCRGIVLSIADLAKPAA